MARFLGRFRFALEQLQADNTDRIPTMIGGLTQ